MTTFDQLPPPTPGRKRARAFKIASFVILLFGLGGAGLVGYLSVRPQDSGFTLTGDSKAELRQVETMYGTQGVLIQDWQNDLKQPRTQIGLLLLATALLAGGCLYIARLSAREDE